MGILPSYKKAPVLQDIKNDPVMGPYYATLVTAQHSRPAIPVGAFYAAQLNQMVSNAVYGTMTSLEALRAVKQNTMKEWERFKRELGV
jgi:multiple sugar transport system substrate-binding protein